MSSSGSGLELDTASENPVMGACGYPVEISFGKGWWLGYGWGSTQRELGDIVEQFRADGEELKAYWEFGFPAILGQFASGLQTILSAKLLPPKGRAIKERLLPQVDPTDPEGLAFFQIISPVSVEHKLRNYQVFLKLMKEAEVQNRRNPDCDLEIEVSIPLSAVDATIQALTDIRTMVGMQLGIENEDDELRLSEHLNRLLGGDAEMADLPRTLQENAMLSGTYLFSDRAVKSLLLETASV